MWTRRLIIRKSATDVGTPQKEAHPLCNAIYRPAGSIERDTMSLHYLKPAQMDLLTNGPSQLGIEGTAYIRRRKELLEEIYQSKR